MADTPPLPPVQPSLRKELFSCRIVTLEYGTIPVGLGFCPLGATSSGLSGGAGRLLEATQTPLTGKSIRRSPIVRIFGPTLDGQNVCLVVHGVYPHFFIEWTEPLRRELLTLHEKQKKGVGGTDTSFPSSPAASLLASLAHTIDEGLRKRQAESSNAAPRDSGRGGLAYSPPFVYNIQILFRRSIYGYDQERHPFLKISMLDIRQAHHAAALLLEGGFLGISLQPYEVHLIGLQFLADDNLKGMDFVFIETQHLNFINDNRRGGSGVICDSEVHVHKNHLINQYTTILHPDDTADYDLLIKHHVQDKDAPLSPLTSSLESPGSPHHCLRTPDLLDLILMEPLTSWKKKELPLCDWPSDFDDPRAPPVCTPLEVYWQEEDRRREKLKAAKAQTLFEKHLNKKVKEDIEAINMIESDFITPIAKRYGRELIPDKMYSDERQLPTPTMNENIPQEPQNHLVMPIYRDPKELPTRTILRAEKSRIKKMISTKGRRFLMTAINSLLNNNGNNKNVFVYYKLPPPTNTLVPPNPPDRSHNLSASQINTQLILNQRLSANLDTRGRQLPSAASAPTVKPVKASPQREQTPDPSKSATPPRRIRKGYLGLLQEVTARRVANRTPSPSPPSTSSPVRLSSSGSRPPRTSSSSASSSSGSSPPSARRRRVSATAVTSVGARSLNEGGTVGVQYGRLLCMEIIPDMQFSKKGGRELTRKPASLGQSLRPLLDPETDRIVGVVFVCRIELTAAQLEGRVFDIVEKMLPEGVGEHNLINRWRPDSNALPYVECEGLISVDDNIYGTCKREERELDPGQVRYSFIVLDQDSLFLLPKKGGVKTGINLARYSVPSESDLIFFVIDQLFRRYDPAIVTGFDTSTASVGFLIKRGFELNMPYIDKHLGRLPPRSPLMIKNNEDSPSNRNSSARAYAVFARSGFVNLPGRLTLNLWTLLKGEVRTNQHTLHGFASHLLNVTLPTYPLFTLSRWWFSADPSLREHSVHYTLECLRLSLKLLTSLDLLERFEQLSRLYGTDLWSAISRGSQHQVEALFCRPAHALGYLMRSASKKSVREQPAVMSIPLVLEPESSFYWWPVAVLDFQSLYPSIVIAYNLCYSTCLGRKAFTWLRKSAATALPAPPAGHPPLDDSLSLGIAATLPNLKATILDELFENLERRELPFHVTSDETTYVSRKVRRGILASLLEEIISTRIMLKDSIKLLKENENKESVRGETGRLIRLQNHRQFGLKMFANVTYGYTTASYSGRMPCAEIADTIVQVARRTLERSIYYIEQHPTWNARVVYGDTDSMFVLLEGRDLEEAFRVGKEMVDAITAMNPWPMELKLEKVYHPCCLQTKKRYVGWSYESAEGVARLDSKGIEVIRRDQCNAVSRTLQETLISLFTSRDVLKCKDKLQMNFNRMITGEPLSNLTDYIFLRRLKFGSYAFERGAPAHTLPPQAVVSYALLNEWKRGVSSDEAMPFDYGSRLPYVVVNAPPGSRLIDQVVPPYRTKDGSLPLCPLNPSIPQADERSYSLWSRLLPLHLNVDWYISRQIIPVLQRMLCLLPYPINIHKWYTGGGGAGVQLQLPTPIKLEDLKNLVIADQIISKDAPPKNINQYQTPILSANNSDPDPAPDPEDSVSSLLDLESLNDISFDLVDETKDQEDEEDPSIFDIEEVGGVGSSTNEGGVGSSINEGVGTSTEEPPKKRQKRLPIAPIGNIATLPRMIKQSFCKSCNTPSKSGVCIECLQDERRSAYMIGSRINRSENQFAGLSNICVNCTGSLFKADSCHSAFHCPVYSRRLHSRQTMLHDIEDW